MSVWDWIYGLAFSVGALFAVDDLFARRAQKRNAARAAGGSDVEHREP